MDLERIVATKEEMSGIRGLFTEARPVSLTGFVHLLLSYITSLLNSEKDFLLKAFQAAV